MRWQFIKDRWWELRTGAGNYLTMAVTFFNLVLLVSLRLDITGAAFYLLAVVIFVTLSSAAVLLGFGHRKLQQETDARLTIPDSRVNDIADAVVRKLEERD